MLERHGKVKMRMYIGVEPYNLYRYLDEQAFRYNRKDDAARFVKTLESAAGRRLTYDELRGRVGF